MHIYLGTLEEDTLISAFTYSPFLSSLYGTRGKDIDTSNGGGGGGGGGCSTTIKRMLKACSNKHCRPSALTDFSSAKKVEITIIAPLSVFVRPF